MDSIRKKRNFKTDASGYRKAVLLLGVLLSSGTLRADTKLRQFLTQNCVNCHGLEKQEGEVRLESRWQYTDADSAIAPLTIANAESPGDARFVVPNEPGKQVQMILEVTDNGAPSLVSYRPVAVRSASQKPVSCSSFLYRRSIVFLLTPASSAASLIERNSSVIGTSMPTLQAIHDHFRVKFRFALVHNCAFVKSIV